MTSTAPPLVRWSAPAGRLPLGAILGAIAATGGALVGLFRLDHLPFTVCLFKALTGLPCPTCGSTRAAGCLARGDVTGALAMNPLATMAFFGLLLWAVADLVLLTRGRAIDLTVSPRLSRVLRVAAVAALVVNWAFLIAAHR
jgi:hypothetical protein